MNLPAHITGDLRTELAAHLRHRYEHGASVRDLADSIDRPYGFVHRILAEAGTQLRKRGPR